MNNSDILTHFDFSKQRNWGQNFLSFDITKFEHLLREKEETFWQKAGEKHALKLFHLAAKRVPAYRDFLKKHKINHQKIVSIKDFQYIPITNKKNYINAYDLDSRSWSGTKLYPTNIVAVNAGTTGTLKLWPRGSFQEFETSIIHELIYKDFFEIHKHTTLLIIGFPIGLYVSGIATVLPSWSISNKRPYKLMVACVGNKKEDIIDFMKKMRDSRLNYDQIIITGHPFFVKDLVESVDISEIKPSKDTLVKFLFASEGFTEDWRNHILTRVNSSYEPHYAINLYGTTELLILGHETPFSISLKEEAESNDEIQKRLFKNGVAANLFQYNPLFRYAESIDDNLLFTAAGGIPLIRFDVGNLGEIINYTDLQKIPLRKKIALPKWHLPLIVLKGRNNYVLEFYVAHINPDYVRQALDNRKYFNKLTGKFTMRKTVNIRLNQVLEIHIELNKKVKATQELKEGLKKSIIASLRKCDYRYDVFYNSAQKLAEPKVKLWDYQHPKYFKPGIKPRYITET